MPKGTLYMVHNGYLSKIASEKLLKDLLPHQQNVVDKIEKDDQPGLILMHGLGSGKTLSSIAAYKHLNMPAEVVVPASLQQNYKKELKKWIGRQPKDVNIRSQQGLARNGIDPAQLKDKLLVIDEAHRMRNSSTKLYKSLKNNPAKKRLLLTGTPTYNHPSDIATLVNLASNKDLLPDDRAKFEANYINNEEVSPSLIHRLAGVRPGIKQTIKNKGRLSHILNKMVDYYPGDKENYPSVNYEDVGVEMSPKQEEIYNAIMGKLPRALRIKVKLGLPPSKQDIHKLMPFLTGARTISNTTSEYTQNGRAESPKLDKATEFLSQQLKANPDYKALVYSNFLNSGLNVYKKKLDEQHIPYGEFTGEMNDDVRQRAVAQYNKNKIKALLISSAGGEGLDLKGTRLVQILEPHFNIEKIKQVVGRAARYKSHADLPEDQRNVLVQNYYATLKQKLTDRLMNKRQTSSDQYLMQMSKEKQRLNDEMLNLIDGRKPKN